MQFLKQSFLEPASPRRLVCTKTSCIQMTLKSYPWKTFFHRRSMCQLKKPWQLRRTIFSRTKSNLFKQILRQPSVSFACSLKVNILQLCRTSRKESKNSKSLNETFLERTVLTRLCSRATLHIIFTRWQFNFCRTPLRLTLTRKPRTRSRKVQQLKMAALLERTLDFPSISHRLPTQRKLWHLWCRTNAAVACWWVWMRKSNVLF